MRIQTSLLFFIIFISPLILGQTAEDYYHNAAQFYIGGKFRDAIEQIEKGLELDPTNPKLQALKDQVEEEEEKQQQMSQQQEDFGDDQNQQQNNEEDTKEKNQQEEEEKQRALAEQNQEQEQQQAAKPEEKKELSKEEAEQILRALRSKEEGDKKLRPMPRQSGKVQVEKDW